MSLVVWGRLYCECKKLLTFALGHTSQRVPVGCDEQWYSKGQCWLSEGQGWLREGQGWIATSRTGTARARAGTARARTAQRQPGLHSEGQGWHTRCRYDF